MDSLTQAVLGASICGSTIGRYHGRKAAIAGAVLATLPDLDVVMRYQDPILAMTSHRGFSHSLFVLTGLALLLTCLWRLMRPDPRYGASRLFLALWLTLITHPLLDAFTSYGTQLLWPLEPIPQSWASIFIIDPVYTLPLLVATLLLLGWGGRSGVIKTCHWALGLSTAYLALTVTIQHHVDTQAQARVQQLGYTPTASFTTPELFTTLLWRSIVRTDAGVDCEVITGLLDTTESEYFCAANNHHLADNLPTATSLQRLRWFSGDWVRFDVQDDLLIVSDLRMGAGSGNYSFRFVVGEQDDQQNWREVTPYKFGGWHNFGLIKAGMNRVLRSTTPLPLADWAKTIGMQVEPYHAQLSENTLPH
ncbi:metal-dependent hydrolase [Paenalcaligenes sp. Me52]|uniref:metal-dependent hydrolase n=1 Tax=Paenalcaligenes sp. Me52 TaxID=3392038 RepID=UPI003D2BAC98